MRDLTMKLLDGVELTGEEAKRFMKIMFGPSYWKVSVALALVYLDRNDVDKARVALEEALDLGEYN